MNKTIPDSSGVGHATTKIAGKAEKDEMSTEIITEGGIDRVLVYNTVRTRVASCIHASHDERELDKERRSALGRKVDGDIEGVERMSVSVAEKVIRNQEDASRWVTYRPKTPPLRPWLIAAWVSTALYALPTHTQGSEVEYWSSMGRQKKHKPSLPLRLSRTAPLTEAATRVKRVTSLNCILVVKALIRVRM